MSTSASRERQPLIAGSSQLNPLAASFDFKPASTSGSNPSTSSSPSPSIPAPASAQQPPPPSDDQEWNSQLRRAHTLSPHTPSYVDRESDGSSDSGFSYDSDAPSRREFRRAHLWVQFPISFLVCAGFTAGLGFWKREVRWLEMGLGAVAWLGTEPLKEVIFDLLQKPRRDSDGQIIKGSGMGLPTIAHALVQEIVRLGAIIMAVALLPEPIHIAISSSFAPLPRPSHPGPHIPREPLPPLDTLFFSALWVGAGWSIAEIVWNSRDFWQHMKLYDDVLDDGEWDEEDAVDDVLESQGGVIYGRGTYGATALSERGNGSAVEGSDKHRMVKLVSPPGGDEDEVEVSAEEEAKLDARIRDLERDEVEAQLGLPLYEIPVAVVVVWRLDSILLALVLTLFQSLPFRTTDPSIVPFPLWPTFFIAAFTRVCLSLIWVTKVPFLGIPTVSYVTLVLLVALLFGVLAAWGALE